MHSQTKSTGNTLKFMNLFGFLATMSTLWFLALMINPLNGKAVVQDTHSPSFEHASPQFGDVGAGRLVINEVPNGRTDRVEPL
jgi:hypothetical protein